jgi:nucleoside 2-deoxyribosyltransferase
MSTIFLSYASNDTQFARDLGRQMEQLGVEVEELSSTLKFGSEWANGVQRRLEKADAILLIVPKAGATGANNAFFEAGAAHALGKPVLAVVPGGDLQGQRELPAEVLNFAVMRADADSLGAVARSLVNALEAA